MNAHLDSKTQILSGIKVLEISTGVSGAFAGRLLSIYGADVIIVEPPGGHQTRYESVWDGDENPENSTLFAYLGSGKRSIQLDLHDESQISHLKQLAQNSDVVIENYPPGFLKDCGFDTDEIANTNPHITVCHISSFGQTGPNINWKTTSLTAAAAGGQLYMNGDADKPPMRTAGHQAYYQTGLHAFGGILAGLYGSRTSGIGDIIDLSIQEVQVATLEGGGPNALWYGTDYMRVGNNPRAMWGVYKSKNGHIGIASMPRQTDSVLDVLGFSELKGDPVFSEGGWSTEADELLKSLIPDFTVKHTSEEIFEMADTYRAPFAMIPTPKDLLEWTHYKETEFWQKVSHPSLGEHVLPSGPIIFGENERGIAHPSPMIGQHSDEILNELNNHYVKKSKNNSPNMTHELPLPLTGITVIDTTQVWSGPYGARFLADMGAEVIKVEGPTFPDPIRTAFVDKDGSQINLSPYFNEYNRGKKSLTVDIKQPEGQQILKDLILKADIFIENWSSGVAERNGLGYKDISIENPGLIYISMPGFGHRGPDSSRIGFGPTIEQMGGLVALQGYPNEGPHKSGISYGDPIAGSTCAAAALASLLKRTETGIGQYCVIPQRDGVTGFIGEYLVAESIGTSIPLRTNSESTNSAPSGIYRCIPSETPRVVLGPDKNFLAELDEQWIAIECQSNEEWKSLVQIIGDSRLIKDEFLCLRSRIENNEFIDKVISEWTKSQSPFELSESLQIIGISASPVMSPLMLKEDPHLKSRNNFIKVKHDLAGEHLTARPTWRLKRRPSLPEKSGPVFGADNQSILLKLGISIEDQQNLSAKNIISNNIIKS